MYFINNIEDFVTLKKAISFGAGTSAHSQRHCLLYKDGRNKIIINCLTGGTDFDVYLSSIEEIAQARRKGIKIETVNDILTIYCFGYDYLPPEIVKDYDSIIIKLIKREIRILTIITKGVIGKRKTEWILGSSNSFDALLGQAMLVTNKDVPAMERQVRETRDLFSKLHAELDAHNEWEIAKLIHSETHRTGSRSLIRNLDFVEKNNYMFE